MSDLTKRCGLCEKKKETSDKPFAPIETKANGTLKVCERCANWIRTHRYAA
jgi:hypothetical protein